MLTENNFFHMKNINWIIGTTPKYFSFTSKRFNYNDIFVKVFNY